MFIEVTEEGADLTVLINVDNIIAIIPEGHAIGDGTRLIMNDDETCFIVKEKYADIVRVISGGEMVTKVISGG